jgi:hypothetical protein
MSESDDLSLCLRCDENFDKNSLVSLLPCKCVFCFPCMIRIQAEATLAKRLLCCNCNELVTSHECYRKKKQDKSKRKRMPADTPQEYELESVEHTQQHPQYDAIGSDVDSVALFERAKDRLEVAQRELATAQKNMTQVREQMRSNGGFEPDSLLYLCVGEDDHVLSAVMEFLTIEDVGRCEMVCRTLKLRAKHCWDRFDEDLLNDTSRRSPSAQDARERVVRYHLASNLARRIGGMGESMSKHLIVDSLDEFGDLIDKRVHDCCEGCDFPEELNFGVFRRDRTNDYELFVRFSRTSDNHSFAEGFLPFEHHDESRLDISLKDMNFSKWPKIVEITRLVKNEDVEECDNLLDECMKELTTTVVAIDKTSSGASLVLAQSNFAGSNSDMDGIDNMGDHGFCWPRGRLSSHSHGALEMMLERGFLGMHRNRNSDAKLGMLFSNRVWTDAEDNERILACEWTLTCAVTLQDS